MICENANLASLDRQLSNFYRQSWDRADEGKRGLLLGTRQQFNARRDACAFPDCLTTAYVARLREIGDIMAGRAEVALRLAPNRPDQRRDAADQGGNREQGGRIENEHSEPPFQSRTATPRPLVPYAFPICNRKIPRT
jgi:uncharacterized protein